MRYYEKTCWDHIIVKPGSKKEELESFLVPIYPFPRDLRCYDTKHFILSTS